MLRNCRRKGKKNLMSELRSDRNPRKIIFIALVNRNQIANTDILEVWRQPRGQRLNADVIVIHGPSVMSK